MFKKFKSIVTNELVPSVSDGFKSASSAVGSMSNDLKRRATQTLEQTDNGKQFLLAGEKVATVAGDIYDGAALSGNKMLANLSGAEAHASIVKLVEQQSRYNDILATRLAEALDRIQQLEKQVTLLHER